MPQTKLILLPKQIEALTFPKGVDADYCLYQGGWGSGKTTAAIRLFQIAMQQSDKGVRCLFASDTLTRLESVTLPPLLEALEEGGLTSKDYRYSNGLLTIKPFNSLAFFRGIGEKNKPTVLRGLDPDIAILEEPSTLPEVAFDEFLGRLRGGRTKLRVLLVSNPQERKSWFYERFVQKAGIKLETVRRKGLDGIEYEEQRRINYRRIVASTYDNPFLSSDYLASLQGLDEKTYRMNVLGEDGDYSEGLVSYNFSSANIDENLTYDPTRRLYVSCDFNFDPNCWVIAQRYGREYHFIDEICLENSDSSNNARVLGERYGEHETEIIILGDASGKAAKSAQVDPRALSKRSTRQVSGDYLLIERTLEEAFDMGRSRFDFDYPDGNGAIDKRVKAWNAATCDVSGVRRIKVHPKCKWLLWNVHNLYYQAGTSEIWKPHANDIKKDARLKYVGHAFDAASYLVNRYSPLEMDPKRANYNQNVISEPFVPQRGY